MKVGQTLSQLVAELDRTRTLKQDMIVPTQLVRHQTVPGEQGSLIIVGNPANPGRQRSFQTTELFRRQLAEKLGIPWVYFERMRRDQPDLLDANANRWLHEEPEDRMIRTLEGKARAFLSNRYRRLDNWDLMAHVLPMLKALPGARIDSMQLTETRMFLKVVTPRVVAEISPGDFVHAGVAITNSEVGRGSLTVQPLVFRLVCTNGLIAPVHTMRKTHLGRELSSSDMDEGLFREDTIQADDKAFYLKVRDVVEDAVSQVTFELLADKMRRTRGIKLTGNVVKSIETLAVKYLLNETEQAGVLSALIEEGDGTGYGLVNAVTGFAQRIDDYERSTELETIAGKMIHQTDLEWKVIATAT